MLAGPLLEVTLSLRCFRFKMALPLLLALSAATGCGTTAGQENDYTCTGVCSGEPMPTIIIQAPDPETACTEYLENCRGQGTCSSCS
jgi:hypothetical protein